MTLTRRQLLTFALTAAIPGLPAIVCAQVSDLSLKLQQSSESLPYSSLEEVQAYIEETSAATQLPKNFIADTLDLATYSPRVEQLMTPKPKAAGAAPRSNWAAYRRRMVNRTRIQGGCLFLDENEQAFSDAEDQFGVPRDFVAAIIGIETVYGRNQGGFRVLDALCTLSFDYKRRADYFRKELTEFLLLVREQNLDPTSVLGSFAGAIGMVQFMPSSVRKLAVDYDHDGKIDLVNSPADAVGSVANYLANSGWVRGLPAYFTCTPETGANLGLVKGGIQPNTTLGEVLKNGFVPDLEIDLPDDEPLLIVNLPTKDPDGNPMTEYRLGTRNFAAILSYNRSYFYASAVADLAQEIETASMDKEASEMAESSSAAT